MKFKTFYLKTLNETPHVLLYSDQFFDFRRENGSEWVKQLADLYKKHKDKVKEMTKNLLGDMFFKIAFKTDIKKIDKSELEKLHKVLPKEFFN